MRRVEKVMSRYSASEIKEALQTCAGHSDGAEAAIHAMKKVLKDKATDAVPLIGKCIQ